MVILRSAQIKAERRVTQTSTLKDRNVTARPQPGPFFHEPSSWIILNIIIIVLITRFKVILTVVLY